MFQNATRLRDATRFAHQDGERSKRAGRLALWQSARPLTQRQGVDFQSASRRPVGWRGRYQEAMRPPPGISVWVIPEPPDGEPVVVPVRRVYFVINNVTLYWLPDGLLVPVFNLSLSLDAAS